MFVGIDIVDIERIKDAVTRTPGFVERLYTRQELEYCMHKKNPYPSLAARFAAREAFRKLDNSFARGIHFHDVEILTDENGKPYLNLHGNALDKVEELGIKQLSVSLSHSKEQAIAIVIASRE